MKAIDRLLGLLRRAIASEAHANDCASRSWDEPLVIYAPDKCQRWLRDAADELPKPIADAIATTGPLPAKDQA